MEWKHFEMTLMMQQYWMWMMVDSQTDLLCFLLLVHCCILPYSWSSYKPGLKSHTSSLQELSTHLHLSVQFTVCTVCEYTSWWIEDHLSRGSLLSVHFSPASLKRAIKCQHLFPYTIKHRVLDQFLWVVLSYQVRVLKLNTPSFMFPFYCPVLLHLKTHFQAHTEA